VCERHGLPFGRYYETAEEPDGETSERDEQIALPATALGAEQQMTLSFDSDRHDRVAGGIA
jgi:hypothetical protein